MRAIFASGLAAGMLAALAVPAAAEVNELKIGKQYGLPYIQFVIMEDQKLIEKHAKLQGLPDLKINWATLGGRRSSTTASSRARSISRPSACRT